MTRITSKPDILERTYFVHGFRVEERRNGSGRTTWSCECEEFARSRPQGEPWCVHAQRVSAGVSIDGLLGSEGLILRPTVC